MWFLITRLDQLVWRKIKMPLIESTTEFTYKYNYKANSPRPPTNPQILTQTYHNNQTRFFYEIN